MGLATSLRPSKFTEVFGQDDAVGTLRSVLNGDDPPHAYLLHGASGLGKTTLARIAARKIGAKGENIIELDGASHSGVDAWRQFQDIVRSAPRVSKSLAIVVDECHSLTMQAWQTLLKLVEEPPRDVFWFFCTTLHDKVPDTIRSRCVQIRLRTPYADDIQEFLDTYKDKHGLSEKVTAAIAEQVANYRQALQAADSLASQSGKVKASDVPRLLEAVHEEAEEAITLCRQLMKGASLDQLIQTCYGMQDVHPESIRRVVVSYFVKVAGSEASSVKAKGRSAEKRMQHALRILDAFSESFYGKDTVGPVMLSCTEVLYGE